jgi:hypothetical protein
LFDQVDQCFAKCDNHVALLVFYCMTGPGPGACIGT